MGVPEHKRVFQSSNPCQGGCKFLNTLLYSGTPIFHIYLCFTETLYNNNIVVWYHDNKEDTSLVKQVILPALDRAKLSYLIYTQPQLDIRGQKLDAQGSDHSNEG